MPSIITDTIELYAEQCEAERRAAFILPAMLDTPDKRRAYRALHVPQDDGDPHFVEMEV